MSGTCIYSLCPQCLTMLGTWLLNDYVYNNALTKFYDCSHFTEKSNLPSFWGSLRVRAELWTQVLWFHNLTSYLFFSSLNLFVTTWFKPLFVLHYSGSPLGIWSFTVQTTKETHESIIEYLLCKFNIIIEFIIIPKWNM